MDITRSEVVEADLTRLIERRHDRRVVEEGERPLMEAWRAAELREEARQREENRAAWSEYFERLAGILRTRAEEYNRRAEELSEGEGVRS